MQAQRLRKALWLANAVLVAGVVGVGALLLLDTPLEAKGAPKWADDALKAYKDKPVTIRMPAAVEKGEIENVFLKPEWKDLPYFPFVGPRIPAPRPKETAVVEQPKGPTGLEAIGRVRMLLFRPPQRAGERALDSVVGWEFTSGEPKNKEFRPDDFIAQKGQRERFKLVDVIQIERDASRWKLLYEVYDDPTGRPTSTGELVYDNEPRPDGKYYRPPPPPAGAPGTGAGTAAPAAPAAAPGGPKPGGTPGVIVVGEGGGTPAASSAGGGDWAPEIREVAPGRRSVVFNEATFEKFKGQNVEKVLENFRTEEYARGGVQGLEIIPVGDASVADKFQVKRGDVLISIDGKPTRTRDDAIRVARGISPDATRVTVELDRDGQRVTYEVDPRDPKTRRAAASVAPR